MLKWQANPYLCRAAGLILAPNWVAWEALVALPVRKFHIVGIICAAMRVLLTVLNQLSHAGHVFVQADSSA